MEDIKLTLGKVPTESFTSISSAVFRGIEEIRERGGGVESALPTARSVLIKHT